MSRSFLAEKDLFFTLTSRVFTFGLLFGRKYDKTFGRVIGNDGSFCMSQATVLGARMCKAYSIFVYLYIEEIDIKTQRKDEVNVL